jgi:diguanylate cyclase (GGDEF)-like protein
LPQAVAPAGVDVLSELGRGATSTVYRVRRNGDEYALKVLDSRGRGSAQTLVAFRREAALLASVNHPAVPRIHEIGAVQGQPYLVTDLVKGRSLAELLAGGALSPDRAVAVCLDVLDALSAVHRVGLVHRDIKPQNIMVLDDGEARLIDFGLAGRGTGAESERDAVVGTLAYSAPEQSGVLKRPVDRRSDLYSLGVTVFECVTGQLPFIAPDVGELLRMHATVPPPDPGTLAPGIPGTLSAIILKLLAKDPDDRYQTGEQVIQDLARLLTDPAAVFVPGTAPVEGALSPEETHLDSPLSGRAAELAELRERWARAAAGRGSIALVRGTPGVGKSRLAREVVRAARRQNALVLQAKCDPDDPVPLAPLRAAMDGHLRAVAGLPEPDREEALARLREAAGPAAPLLATLSPRLGRLLQTERVGEADWQDQFTEAVAGLLLELARHSNGLLLFLDDVQWLDAATQRVVHRLCVDLARVPVLVLATARDDEDSRAPVDAFAAAAGDSVATDLTLGALTERDVAALVSARLPGVDAGVELGALLAVRGNGNPFVIGEYLRAVVDAGLLHPSWGSWELDVAGLDALDLPQDAIGLVLSRIEDIGADAERVLVAAAALGTHFRADVVAAVCDGLERHQVQAALAEATARRLIEDHEPGEYAFVHDRIREAMLTSDEAAAAALHQHIAEVLDARPAAEPEYVYAVAHHYLRGQAHADPARRLAACRAAGRLALENHAAEQAVAFLEPAAAIVVDGREPDAEFLLLLGTALERAGRFADAEYHLERALQLESESLARAAILARIADVHRASWDSAGVRRAVHRALAELQYVMPRGRVRLVLSTLWLALVGTLIGLTGIGFGTAKGEQRERLRLISALHMSGARAGTLDSATGETIMHRLRSIYPLSRLGPCPEYVRGMAGLGFLTGMVGRHRLSARLLRSAMVTARRLADPTLVATVDWYEGLRDYLGARDDGERWLRSVDEHSRWLSTEMCVDATAALSWDSVVRGRTGDASARYERGLDRLAASGLQTTPLLIAAVVVTAMTGRRAEAATMLRRAQDSLAAVHGRGMMSNLLLAEIYSLLEQAELGEPLDQALAAFEKLAIPPRFANRGQQPFFVYQAFARLAQCRFLPDVAPGPQGASASPGQAAASVVRLRTAAAAVDLLRKAARTPQLRAFERAARADLLTLQGEPAKALEQLAAIPPQQPEIPVLTFEAARVRARALRSLGCLEEAEQHALFARTRAAREGWPHRARWVESEFGLAGGSASTTTSAASVSHAGMTVAGVQRQRLQALEQVSNAATRVIDPDALARIALDETIRILSAERAFLFLVEGEGDDQQLVPRLGRNAAGEDVGRLTGYSTTLVERVRTTREPLVVTGTEEGEALGAQSVVLHGLRSIMVAPLQLESRLLGVVYLDSQVAKGIFTPEDAGILTALTNHIATALETARAAQLEVSVASARQQREVAERLREAFTGMSHLQDPDQVLGQLLDAATRLLPGIDVRLLPQDAAATFAGTLEPGAPWTALPLETRDGTVCLLALVGRDAVEEANVELAGALVAQATTAYDNASLLAEVQRLAEIDELTGLANRRRLFDLATRELSRSRRKGTSLAALMLDIDHFKQVNDGYGHPTGDDVIRIVGARLAAAVREDDVLGRYGGEEFAVVLTDSDASADVAERLRRAVADEPVPTRSGDLAVTVSVGLAVQREGDDLTGLLARADRGLYRAKQEGRNRVGVSD